MDRLCWLQATGILVVARENPEGDNLEGEVL